MVVSIVSVTVVAAAPGRPTRASKLPPRRVPMVRRPLSASTYTSSPVRRNGGDDAAAGAGGDGDGAAVGQRDRHGAACAAAGQRRGVGDAVPPSATLGVAVRLTVVVSIVSVIGRPAAVSADQVLEVAAGGAADRGRHARPSMVRRRSARRHGVARCRCSAPAAMVIVAPLSA